LQALVGEGRRETYVDHRDVGLLVEEGLAERRPGVDRGYHLEAVVGEGADQTVAEQEEVFGEDYADRIAHGTSR
jgi:hypothetical protein